MIAVAGVVVLAVAGIAVTVLSAVADRHPDRAAMLVVLAAAGGGMLTFLVALAVPLLVGLRGGGAGGPQALPAVTYSLPRLAGGLAVAGALVATAVWLIRTGDWTDP